MTTIDEMKPIENIEDLVMLVLHSHEPETYLDQVNGLTIFQQVQLIESLPAEKRLSVWGCVEEASWWSLIGYLQVETSRNLVRSLSREEQDK